VIEEAQISMWQRRRHIHAGDADKEEIRRTSEPLEMISRRKMSLFWYSELIMMSMRRFTSAWNS
jgi:hypothetical protein